MAAARGGVHNSGGDQLLWKLCLLVVEVMTCLLLPVTVQCSNRAAIDCASKRAQPG